MQYNTISLIGLPLSTTFVIGGVDKQRYCKELIDLEFLTHNTDSKYRNSHSKMFYRNNSFTEDLFWSLALIEMWLHSLKNTFEGVQLTLAVGLHLYSKRNTCTGVFNRSARVTTFVLDKRRISDVTQHFNCKLLSQWFQNLSMSWSAIWIGLTKKLLALGLSN